MTTCVTKIKYSMPNVQDLYRLFIYLFIIFFFFFCNNAVHPVICDDWHYIYMWKTLAFFFLLYNLCESSVSIV